MGRNVLTAEQFLKAIPKTGGIITLIAKKIPCEWHTAKRFIFSHPSVTAAYQDESESILDLAESKLIDSINNGDPVMIKFILQTKGKNRGYTERQEVTGADGGPVVIKVVYDDKKTEEPEK